MSALNTPWSTRMDDLDTEDVSGDHLKPCGTHAAWARHKHRGEDPCDACTAAHRAYLTRWARDARAQYPTGTCTACQRERPIQRYGWCESCVSRWYKAGRPDTGPPPLDRPAPRRTGTRVDRENGGALREDFAWLLDTGESIEMAAARVGIALGTAHNWHQQWQRQRTAAA